MVTIIADNYYGYCKKEVKTQISFAANLFGLCEEEHAGGAIAFATYVLGQDFYAGRTVSLKKAAFDDAMRMLGPMVERSPEGYAIDRRYPDIYYVPEDAEFNVREGIVRWPQRRRAAAAHAARARSYLRPAHRFPRSLEKQTCGHRVATGRLAPSRHAVPQALHRFRRRQIRNFEVHRQRRF